MGMHLFGGQEFMVMGHDATICLLLPVLIFVHSIQLSIIDEFEFDGTFLAAFQYSVPYSLRLLIGSHPKPVPLLLFCLMSLSRASSLHHATCSTQSSI